MPSLEEFVQAIANIDDERVRELGKKLVASEDPKKVIEAIVEGMKVVGDKYERLEVLFFAIIICLPLIALRCALLCEWVV